MKKLIIPGIIIIIIILVFLGISLVKPSNNSEEIEEIPTPTVSLPTISKDINVLLKPKSENKAVSLTISGLPIGIESVEYELTYTTAGGLPRGVLGKISVKENQKEISRDDIVLGTCSSGKCVYDLGVKAIDLSLKFNSITGDSSVFRKNYPL